MADMDKKAIPDEKTNIDRILENYDELGNDPSLKSILAEFKGDAFIDGDKRTPPDVLQEKTDDIVEQYTGRRPVSGKTEPEKPKDIFDIKKPVVKTVSIKPEEEKDDADRWFEEFISGGNPAPISVKAPKMPKIAELTPDEEENADPAEPVENCTEEIFTVKFGNNEAEEPVVDENIVNKAADFDSVSFSDPAAVDDFAEKLSHTLEREAALDGSLEERNIGHRKPVRTAKREKEADMTDAVAEGNRFAAPIHKLTLKAIGAGAVCIFMTVLTFMYYGGKPLLFGIDTDMFAFTGALMLGQMIVMILGLDVLISGVTDIIRGEPGAESLLVLSSLVSIIDGFVIFIKRFESVGLPFCLVSMWAVFFAVCGRIFYYTAMKDSLRVFASTSSPYGVVSEERMKDRVILKKLPGMTKGFYSNLVQADAGETLYSFAAPIFAVLALVLGFLASVGSGNPENFIHSFSVMLAVAASFPSTMLFALPFKQAAKSVKHSGGAIAGWGGACEVADSDSAIITDEDIFPVGTVSVSGMKLLSDFPEEKAVSYTAGLIIASRSALTKAFSTLIKDEKYALTEVEDFTCYEGGGIGTLIDEDRVMVGTGAFMNLMGIRVPDSINLNNSVFTAVNDKLTAVFTVNYVPANSVHNALESLLNTSVDILLAVRDFNVSPSMIQHKFKVSMEGVRIIPAEISYKVSDEKVPAGTRASAVLCREGLGPLAEVITRGRLLKKITEINSVISAAGSFIGIILMFSLCWTGSFESACVKNVFIFMMGIELCIYLLSKLVSSRN